jgi:hypothetical protein
MMPPQSQDVFPLIFHNLDSGFKTPGKNLFHLILYTFLRIISGFFNRKRMVLFLLKTTGRFDMK